MVEILDLGPDRRGLYSTLKRSWCSRSYSALGKVILKNIGKIRVISHQTSFLKIPGLPSGVSPRFFYCGKTTRASPHKLVFSGDAYARAPDYASKLCQFFHVYARTYARPCGLIFGHLCQFSSIMLAIRRYFDISYCLPALLPIIFRSMDVYACLVFVVDHTRYMVFDYDKYLQHKQEQSTAVAILRSPLFSVSLFSLLFVLLGEPRAKMFIVYMLPYYIEVFYYV